MGVGAESFQGNEICEQSNYFFFRLKTLTNNINPSRNQQLLDHCKVPKNPNQFYFILFFQKEGGLLRKQKRTMLLKCHKQCKTWKPKWMLLLLLLLQLKTWAWKSTAPFAGNQNSIAKGLHHHHHHHLCSLP